MNLILILIYIKKARDLLLLALSPAIFWRKYPGTEELKRQQKWPYSQKVKTVKMASSISRNERKTIEY